MDNEIWIGLDRNSCVTVTTNNLQLKREFMHDLESIPSKVCSHGWSRWQNMLYKDTLNSFSSLPASVHTVLQVWSNPPFSASSSKVFPSPQAQSPRSWYIKKLLLKRSLHDLESWTRTASWYRCLNFRLSRPGYCRPQLSFMKLTPNTSALAGLALPMSKWCMTG